MVYINIFSLNQLLIRVDDTTFDIVSANIDFLRRNYHLIQSQKLFITDFLLPGWTE